MTTYKTAREAWHAWRKREHEADKSDGYNPRNIYWQGGSAAVSRTGGAHRVSPDVTFRPREGRPQFHPGKAFSEIQYAAHLGVMRPGFKRDAESLDFVKSAIRHALSVSQRCPAPVLP